MKNFAIICALTAVILSGSACERIDDGDPQDNPYKELNLSSKSARLASAGNGFAFEFINRVNASEDKDFFISPLSMQFLLGMILNGARGETADEICKVLGYGAGEADAVNEYCLSMLEQLPLLDRKTSLSIANAVFVNRNHSLLDGYKGVVEKSYQAEVSNLDFNDGPRTLETINSWCNRQTNGMIPKVLDEVSPDMLAYLLNAVYFKGQWQKKFSENNTGKERFSTGDGATRMVTMMKGGGSFEYQENDGFRIVRLPYGNGAFSMLVVLPDEGETISGVISRMSPSLWEEVLRSMVRCDVDLWLPKFETKYSRKLNEILSDMGMPSAFNELSADFKAMTDNDIWLSFVKQDAMIRLSEEGTEAAAVSSASFVTSAGPGDKKTFHACRPFLYMITESSSGAIIFAGKYTGFPQES